MTEPLEWECEGCGAHVVAFNTPAIPQHQLCGICAWLCEFAASPEEMMLMYNRLVTSSGERHGSRRR